MKSSSRTFLVLVSFLILSILSFVLPASFAQIVEDGPSFDVTFHKEPNLDHVCFDISVTNNKGQDGSFPLKFLLNETNVDIKKARAELWEEGVEEYNVTHCNECEVELETCTIDNETLKETCVPYEASITDCERCGSWVENKERSIWDSIELTSTERDLTDGRKDLRNGFQAAEIKDQETKRYRLCYYFAAIPEHPDGGWGSYGFMYLDIDGKLFYDFANSSWWNESWEKCRTITINSTLIDEQLTNFTAYVHFDNSTGSFNASASWDEVRFVNASCNNYGSVMDYEREFANTSEAHFFVRLENISNVSDTSFSVYYANPGAPDAENAAGAWAREYEGVWHLRGDSGTNLPDSKGTFNFTKKAVGEPANKDGQILDGAQVFDNTDDFAAQGTLLDYVQQTGFTVSTWIRPDGGWSSARSENDYFAGKRNKNATQDLVFMFFEQSTGLFYTEFRNDDDGIGSLTSNTSVWADVPYHIAVVYGSPNTIVYVNGSYENMNSQTYVMNNGTDQDFYLGHCGYSYFDGTIYEFRISNVRRSAAWIKAEYYSGKDQLLSVGTEEENNVTGENGGRAAILEGIALSTISSDHDDYTDQQIYMRRANGSQDNGMFDIVTVSGTQSWAFNYLTGGSDNPETFMGNLSTVLYVWEDENLTTGDIKAAVKGLIDATNQ